MDSMKILKRTADRLKKENHAEMARWMGDITRQGINVWIHRRSIPDKHVRAVELYTGITIK